MAITEAPLAIEDLLAVAGGARTELGDGIRARIAASQAVVDRALTGGEAVYGLTTQVGHGGRPLFVPNLARNPTKLLSCDDVGVVG